MDELFPLLLFLIFILAPLIEGIRKRGQQQQPPRRPPAQRPLPGPPPPRRSQTEEVSRSEAESASTMIPDELWKILTGEAPPYEPPPRPQPTPSQPWDVVYIPPEEVTEEEVEAEEPRAAADVAERLEAQVRRMRREEAALQARRRRPVAQSLEDIPIIESLETEPLAETPRHTAFHDKLARSEEPAVKRVKKYTLPLGSREELRNAFILQEVLGKPRGLE